MPSASSGSDQAAYFVKHGGGWSDDGITLPGMLDMEFNPYGDDDCYGLSGSEMADWIAEFVDEYKDATGTYPLIYTTTSWWQECTGDSGAFGDKTPLVLARYAEEAGELPAGWGYYTFWQFDDGYAYGGDSQVFNGDEERLKALAKGS